MEERVTEKARTKSGAVSVYAKLTRVQNRLKAPKDKFNNFAGFAYRNAEAIYQAVKPLLEEYGLTLFTNIRAEQIGDRFYLIAEATLVDSDNPEDRITVVHPAREEAEKEGLAPSQVTGTASTYATKYVLMHLFAIDDSREEIYAPDPDSLAGEARDDDEGAANKVKAAQTKGELMTLYAAYPHLHGEGTKFMAALKQRKKEVYK